MGHIDRRETWIGSGRRSRVKGQVGSVQGPLIRLGGGGGGSPMSYVDLRNSNVSVAYFPPMSQVDFKK